MGLLSDIFGGDESTSTTETTTNVTSRSAALEDIDGIGVVGGEGAVNVSVLDGGAIDDAFYFAERTGLAAQETARAGIDQALDFGRAAVVAVGAAGEQASRQQSSALDTLNTAITRVSDASRSDAANVLNNVVKFGGLGLVALAGVYLLTRR